MMIKLVIGKVDEIMANTRTGKNKIYKVPCEKGYYLFKLTELLELLDKTRYNLSKDLNAEYKVINRYAHGNLSRFDANIIAKICDYCDCNLSDIIEYIPNSK